MPSRRSKGQGDPHAWRPGGIGEGPRVTAVGRCQGGYHQRAPRRKALPPQWLAESHELTPDSRRDDDEGAGTARAEEVEETAEEEEEEDRSSEAGAAESQESADADTGDTDTSGADTGNAGSKQGTADQQAT
ncbi:hypothetical protein ABVT39_023652 [Epinephelus coioides]